MIWGGAQCAPPPFLFVKTIEKLIRLCTVLKFFFISCGCGDIWEYGYYGYMDIMGIFHELSIDL